MSDIDADKASRLIAASADIAVIVDRKGVIRDVACAGDAQTAADCGEWVGRTFGDTVTIESKPKVEELLRDAAASVEPRWRQVNHPTRQGVDLPVRYSALQIGSEGRIVAVGRDLRALANLQQRLLSAQGQVEREYERLRNLETRYRTLFHMSGEAILIVDAATSRITEANPAAVKLFANGSKRIVGRPLPDVVAEEHQSELQTLLGAARASPTARDAKLRISSSGTEHTFAISLTRQGEDAYYLVRVLARSSDNGAHPRSDVQASMLQLLEKMPDAFVLVDQARRIVTANPSFIAMAQLAAETQVKGELAERWFGRVGVDLDVLIANLREHGSVKGYNTMVRGEYGSATLVEVAGVAAPPYYGFTIHPSVAESPLPLASLRALPHPIEQLTELVGRAPMKEVVRQTTEIIERMCIDAALRLTSDNRASAAELLGLSRQSLYVKLRRYGLEDGPQL